MNWTLSTSQPVAYGALRAALEAQRNTMLDANPALSAAREYVTSAIGAACTVASTMRGTVQVALSGSVDGKRVSVAVDAAGE